MPTVATVPILNSQSGLISYLGGALIGYSVRETASNRAVLRFRDGAQTDDPANILLTISLAPGESARDWYGALGVAYAYGLYVEIVSGQIEGSAQIMSGRQQ